MPGMPTSSVNPSTAPRRWDRSRADHAPDLDQPEPDGLDRMDQDGVAEAPIDEACPSGRCVEPPSDALDIDRRAGNFPHQVECLVIVEAGGQAVDIEEDDCRKPSEPLVPVDECVAACE